MKIGKTGKDEVKEVVKKTKHQANITPLWPELKSLMLDMAKEHSAEQNEIWIAGLMLLYLSCKSKQNVYIKAAKANRSQEDMDKLVNTIRVDPAFAISWIEQLVLPEVGRAGRAETSQRAALKQDRE